MSLNSPPSLLMAARCVIGAVWIFHGLYSKLLNGIPRHRQIIGRILGEDHAGVAICLIGFLEIGLGLWMISGFYSLACVIVQTLALATMNALEMALARDLLLAPRLMIVCNAVLLTGAWSLVWASGAL